MYVCELYCVCVSDFLCLFVKICSIHVRLVGSSGSREPLDNFRVPGYVKHGLEVSRRKHDCRTKFDADDQNASSQAVAHPNAKKIACQQIWSPWSLYSQEMFQQNVAFTVISNILHMFVLVQFAFTRRMSHLQGMIKKSLLAHCLTYWFAWSYSEQGAAGKADVTSAVACHCLDLITCAAQEFGPSTADKCEAWQQMMAGERIRFQQCKQRHSTVSNGQGYFSSWFRWSKCPVAALKADIWVAHRVAQGCAELHRFQTKISICSFQVSGGHSPTHAEHSGTSFDFASGSWGTQLLCSLWAMLSLWRDHNFNTTMMTSILFSTFCLGWDIFLWGDSPESEAAVLVSTHQRAVDNRWSGSSPSFGQGLHHNSALSFACTDWKPCTMLLFGRSGLNHGVVEDMFVVVVGPAGHPF